MGGPFHVLVCQTVGVRTHDRLLGQQPYRQANIGFTQSARHSFRCTASTNRRDDGQRHDHQHDQCGGQYRQAHHIRSDEGVFLSPAEDNSSVGLLLAARSPPLVGDNGLPAHRALTYRCGLRRLGRNRLRRTGRRRRRTDLHGPLLGPIQSSPLPLSCSLGRIARSRLLCHRSILSKYAWTC